MKRKLPESVTWKDFGKYEKKVWKLECRRAKELAGIRAGWVTGDIVLFSSFLGIFHYYSEVLSDFLPLKFLGILWQNIMDTYLPGTKNLERGSEFLPTMLVPILAALAANLLTYVAVRLLWPKRKFIPTNGSDAVRSEALYQRYSAASEYLPSRRWYFNLIPLIIFTVVFVVDGVNIETAESGPLTSAEITGLFFGLMIIVMIPYFLYRGLSGLIILKLQAISHILHQVYPLRSVLGKYVDLGEKKAEEEQKSRQEEEARIKAEQAEKNRLMGDKLYYQALAGDKVDESLLVKAADLGSCPACLHMGRRLFDELNHGIHTKEEEQKLAERAKNYFYIAAQDKNSQETQIEGKFGYQLFYVTLMDATGLSKSASSSQWNVILSELKAVRASHKLPKRYERLCVQLIDYVADMFDEAVGRHAKRN